MPWVKAFNTEHAIEKAMRLFWARGYEATSIDDLLREMSISRGSMYNAFGDKHSLFMACLRRYDARSRRSQLAQLERESSARQAIEGLFGGWMNSIVEDSAHSGCFLTNTALELTARDPEVRALVEASQRDIERFFLRMIRKGQKQGEISEELDAREESRSLLALLLGLLVLGRSRPEPGLVRSVARAAMARLER